MELNYYVLGKKNNPMLLGYLDKYYDILCNKLRDISQKDILTDDIWKLLDIENRKFILNADISSTINIIHDIQILLKRPIWVFLPEIYQERLQKEIQFFLNKEEEHLITHQWTTIGETNIRLTMADYNPFWAMWAHPDHATSGAGLGWGEKTEKEWLQVYNKTFEVLKIIDEDIYDELNQIITKIIPFGTSYSLHNSCSHKDSIGHLYLGYTVDVEYPEFNNVEAVIHESSHNKLNLILQSEKLILNDMSEKYYSPYRPDARHIHGIYIWLHAFAPVIYILMGWYLRGLMWESDIWLQKILLYYVKNKISYKVLRKHGKFTPLWEKILEEMKYVMDITDTLSEKITNKSEVLQRVITYEKQHFSEVNLKYPYLEY